MGTYVISGRIKNRPRYKMNDKLKYILPKFDLYTYWSYRGSSEPQSQVNKIVTYTILNAN